MNSDNMKNNKYDGPNQRRFVRKIFENGKFGYMRYIGQKMTPTNTNITNEVYPLLIHDIGLHGAGLELSLPKKRKNYVIDEISADDIFTLFYIVPSKCTLNPKIKDMRVVNVKKSNERRSPYETFQIGAEFLEPNKISDLGFAQTNIIVMGTGHDEQKKLVDDIFGIAGNNMRGFLPEKMNLEKNIARLGYSSTRY